jgi:hypothetical protein
MFTSVEKTKQCKLTFNGVLIVCLINLAPSFYTALSDSGL